MQKPPACSCVCPAFSCTAGRALIRSWATGRGALRWVCTLFGEASATCDALVNPANLQAFTCHPWRSRRRGPYRPVVVVRSFAARGGALRSDRVASLGACRHCRPALATARTVWQWHSGGEREERATEGHSVATLHIHTTGHWPQLLSHFTAPAHPPCSARSLPGTVGVICVTDNRLLCASPRLLAFGRLRFFKLRRRARAPRPRRHAVAAVRQSNA